MAADPIAKLPTMRQMLAHAHRRLVLMAVLLSGLTLMLAGFLSIRDYSQRNLALVANTIAYEVEPAMVFGDKVAIRQTLASVAQIHDVSQVDLRDSGGHLIARQVSEPAGVGSMPDRLIGKLVNLPERTAPVRHGGTIVGTRGMPTTRSP